MNNLFGGIYKGRRVLVTGHTGFKGSWLCLWLHEMGAKVSGISLDPIVKNNHWDLLDLNIQDHRIDIRDYEKIKATIMQIQPEYIFHLAAQPLVRESYRDPLNTWSTNVIGTANILDITKSIKSLRAIVVVTTDKCYENKEWTWGYREIDVLGGSDPYAASKACVEILVGSYAKSFFGSEGSPKIATARAGNVVGGGDWSQDRLIPDMVRAVSRGDLLKIRYPKATRPWQHVLESLSGYLSLGQKLTTDDVDIVSAWNFGPGEEGNKTVEDVLHELKKYFTEVRWNVEDSKNLHESNFLSLDCSKAKQLLGWKSTLNFEEGIKLTADWYQDFYRNKNICSINQLKEYCNLATARDCHWTNNNS